jgi:hypothetical protein
MNRLLGDVRYALRGFLKNPLFTIIAITSLALGLGANSAIFNLLDQVLFRPLPVKDAHQLVLLTAPGPGRGSYEGDSFERIFSFPDVSGTSRSHHVFLRYRRALSPREPNWATRAKANPSSPNLSPAIISKCLA